MDNNNIEILKWQGIKNDETNRVCSGYLYLKFVRDTDIINTAPNVIAAKVEQYKAGKCIGFSVQNVSNKREAIQKFFLTHKIIDMDNNIVDKKQKYTFDSMSLPSRKFIRIYIDRKESAHVLQSFGKNIKVYEDEKAEATAAFICKAANNFDSLLNALKEVVATFPVGQYSVKKDFSKLVTLAAVTKAIHKAEE